MSTNTDLYTPPRFIQYFIDESHYDIDRIVNYYNTYFNEKSYNEWLGILESRHQFRALIKLYSINGYTLSNDYIRRRLNNMTTLEGSRLLKYMFINENFTETVILDNIRHTFKHNPKIDETLWEHIICMVEFNEPPHTLDYVYVRNLLVAEFNRKKLLYG